MYQLVRLCVASGIAATFLTALALEVEAAPLTCGGKRVTIVGTDGDDTIVGTNGVDVIHARGGDDRVRGRGGNDLICGGYGRDRLWGGDGNDRLLGGPDRLIVVTDGPDRRVFKVGDVLDGGAGNDRLNGGADARSVDPQDAVPDVISWASSPRGVRVDVPTRRATGIGDDRWAAGTVELWLTEHDDRVTGGPGDDLIGTGAGDDRVSGGAGRDRIDVDGPAAQIGAGGNDLVRAGSGDDDVHASKGRDELRGDDGDDQLIDGGGVGVVRGGAGDDALHVEPVRSPGQVHDGGPGRDMLVHNHGTYLYEATWDMSTGVMVLDDGTTIAASGFERADFAWGDWTVDGTEGPDDIQAGDGPTTFRGHGGDDTFLGSTFDDWFDGGAGNDAATGMRQGDDTCVGVESVPPDCEHVSP